MSELTKIKGRVVNRGDSDYEAVRLSMVRNGIKPDRHPDVIVQAQEAADAVAAVNYARAHKLKVSVRSGGHRWGSPVLREGGVLIDVGSLDTFDIDKQGMTARLGPGVRNDDLLRTLLGEGLYFPAGHCASVPVGGFFLNGGVGWNHGTFGPACFSILSIEMVTPQGELITASESENPDYFWAARGGGGGFFGVVLSYTVRIYPAPGVIQMSTLVFPAARAGEVAAWLQQTVPSLAPGVETIMVMQPAPPELQQVTSHIAVLGGVAFAADAAQADEWLSPLANCPVADCLATTHGQQMESDQLFVLMDSLIPEGMRMNGEALILTGDAGEHMARSASLLADAPSPASSVLSVVLASPPPDAVFPDCSFSMPGNIVMFAYAVWDDAAEDAANLSWLDGFAAAHEPATAGCYIGESRLDRGPSQSEGAFAPPMWQRYLELKRKHDPDGLFHWFLGNEATEAESAT
jgi:FAD/FMN-containing dehydrogenase